MKTIPLNYIVKDNIQHRYRFLNTLGEGSFGKVKVACLIDNPSKKYAIKSIPRDIVDYHGKERQVEMSNVFSDEESKDFDEYDEEQIQDMLEAELQVLMNMDHPNIVKFYQCMYDNNYINIVMELVRGIPLSDYLIERGRIPEDQSQVIIYDIMCAMKYYHQQRIVHRDIKLDNIMLTGLESGDPRDIRVKIIDFGMSKLTRGKKKINLQTYCGTIDFIAPEILEGNNYDCSCDSWSVGVLAYFILSGQPPFMGKDDVQISSKIMTCDYQMKPELWEPISKDA